MDGDRERSLVAWANTFAEAAPAASLADFSNGDALIPIARTIVRKDSDDDDDDDTASGWVGVFSHMEPAGLVEEGAKVPGNEAQKRELAVTCLEDLLRHTVGEHCVGRETFIRQIMSLDAAVQTSLRHIIVGEQPQHNEAGRSSEAGSPVKDHDHDDGSSFAGSPAASAAPLTSPAAGHLTSSGDGSSYEDDDSSHSGGDEDDLSLKSWYSPHPRGSARRKSQVTGGRTGGRAAPVGPKIRQGRTLDMEEAEQALVGETAASAESFPGTTVAVADGTGDGAGWTATAMEVRCEAGLYYNVVYCVVEALSLGLNVYVCAVRLWARYLCT